MENTGTTEKNIVNAARSIFVEKGYDGATMREIASAAGINISMLHYYYRSKDNLFDIVFNDVFQRLYGRAIETIASSASVPEKVRQIVLLYTDTLAQDPRLANFIFNEVTQRPSRVGRFAKYKELIDRHVAVFQHQLDQEAASGRIRAVSVMELLVNIGSLCMYPFMTFPLWQKIFGVDLQDITRLIMDQRETYVQNILKTIEKK